MALNPKLSNVAANAACNAVVDLLDNGYLRIYDGTQPADADTAITTQNLLAELRFAATAFGSAVAGVATANPLVQDSAANASGVATWFRCFESDGTTVIFDGSVDETTGNLVISDNDIVINMVVDVFSGTFTQSKS